jgi:flavin-dependent thymidylate synthase
MQKYIDPAMYSAEPIENVGSGPQVHLISMTADPLGHAAAMNCIYSGKVRRSLRDVTDEERRQVLEDMQRSALKAPLEAIKMHFMFEGVTRAFTHQLVRQRTAVYAQESMRFAVKDGSDLPVAGPSIVVDKYAASQYDADSYEAMSGIWDMAVRDIGVAYDQLISLGMPAEDARGLLPTNTLTRIHYVTDLRGLLTHSGMRLCTQAQFEWRKVFAGIAEQIANYTTYNDLITNVDADNEDVGGWVDITEVQQYLEAMGARDAWQYEAIAKLFRPICYQTGRCEFKATADRSCTIRNRVDANAAAGRPSSEWHEPSGPIQAIRFSEWMMDSTAAR